MKLITKCRQRRAANYRLGL